MSLIARLVFLLSLVSACATTEDAPNTDAIPDADEAGLRSPGHPCWIDLQCSSGAEWLWLDGALDGECTYAADGSWVMRRRTGYFPNAHGECSQSVCVRVARGEPARRGWQQYKTGVSGICR